MSAREPLPVETGVPLPRFGATGARAAFGGFLMGLANLVPGISGGTMLLAAGIYPQIIDGVAELSMFRFRMRTVFTLGCVATSAAVAILSLAGVVKGLVVEQQWVMYSLFIGLTLGGVPLVWRRMRPLDRTVCAFAAIGIALMVGITLLQMRGGPVSDAEAPRRLMMLLLAGAVGGAAMILPGISGGYLLLVLGQYVVVLGAIEGFRDGLATRDWALTQESALLLAVVGAGVGIGVVAVTHILKRILARFPRSTYGALMGLLLGAVIGLWPFQAPVPPESGQVVKGQVVTAENRLSFDVEDWPRRAFQPSVLQLLGSLGLIACGIGLSTAVAHVGRDAE